MANKLDKVFKIMTENGWCISENSKTPSKDWRMLLNYHLSVLDKVFIEYHYEDKTKITEILAESIGFISDFIHAFRGENYGE